MMTTGAAMSGAIDRLEVDANGLTFTARAAGPADGRRVLLLHGFPQTSWCWRSQLSALAEAGYRAVAPDLRGYSARARPPQVSDYAMGHLVADVLALADTMQMDTFDLVGHDWGGMLSWLVATRYPDRVRSLCVVSTPHPLALQHALRASDGAQVAWGDGMEAFLERDVPERLLLGPDGSGTGLASVLTGSGLNEADARVYISVLTQPGALTAALNWYRAMDRADLFDLRPITVPTLFVWSSDDPALGRDAAEGTGDCVDAPYRFEELEGVSHWIPEMAAGALSRLLLEHLADPG
jgi:pimeloyl-ACP methyl ester carboxylesterase